MAPDPDNHMLDMSAPHDDPLPDLEDVRMDDLDELDDRTVFEAYLRINEAETFATAMQSADAVSILVHERGYSIDRSPDGKWVAFTHDEKSDLRPQEA